MLLLKYESTCIVKLTFIVSSVELKPVYKRDTFPGFKSAFIMGILMCPSH